MSTDNPAPSSLPFLGLSPFLRKSIAGTDLRPVAQSLLSQAQADYEDANLLLNLAIAMLCIGQREIGLSIQEQALTLSPTYLLPAKQQPARARVLMLMAPGDLAANTPLECLLENSDIDLAFHYLDPACPQLNELPPHDLIFVAPSESDGIQRLLAGVAGALARWPRPVLNDPARIPQLARHTASQLLQQVPGLVMPPTRRISRSDLNSLAAGTSDLARVAPGHRFPLILRPVGSQAGRDLEQISDRDTLRGYLARVPAEQFYLADFIDYSGPDGLFRKFRVVLVDGQPFAGHMAVSSHWMVHYVNAGMYEEAHRRQEEAAFMTDFAAFAQRHAAALGAIHHRTGLDYLCIDCAETPNGQLLVFEIGNAMVVHAMDPVETFPYKPAPIARIVLAFRELLFRRMSAFTSPFATREQA